MSDTILQQFVKEALSRGASREETENVLREAGWPRDQIADAMSSFSSVAFPVPVPVPKARLSARDAFLYLVMFSMLYLSAYNVGSLLFQFVNVLFPDVVEYRNDMYVQDRIRFSVSAVLIAFPLYLYLSSVIGKQIKAEPSLRLSAVRKWLTYLTLAVSACIIVGDLIYLVDSVLSGGLTVRFVLKVLIIGGVSGAVFSYYLLLMRDDDRVLER